ncbi:acetyl-CoA carboxylase biotin carboxyl carrier protein [Oceanobacillus kimchii]|uniref:acetyl-CoA carboxylase biotin carboxyl carrier protein n=1 Tax=Oceanobacillus kimchii TaxID=746691 RepID=UPI000985EAAC|nr:acetyl-CoA carboxylase biotin carboxyl carrier protein [Oceanobacillus kimchii]
MLNVEELREIIRMVDESSITEFSYETNGTNISMKKFSNQQQVSQPSPTITEVTSQPTVEREPQMRAEETKEATKESSNARVDYDYEITSPMVGTFYSASSPEKDAFVSKGTKVDPSSVVCIVEAMKLFNEIEAEVSGEIVEILVENGELVEYGQPLFRVKK